MNKHELQSFLRRVDRIKYPELADYSWAEVYGNGDQMAPGALFLAVIMARMLDLKPGQKVLDLGCGRGDSSLFLARHFGVHVVAVDYWISAEQLERKFRQSDSARQLSALNLDATGDLPFANLEFDAVFAMQCWHYCGANKGFLAHLLPVLKMGGQVCIGNTCFSTETEIPAIFKTN